MLTLFASISGGLDWESAIQALMEVSGWAVALASRCEDADRLQNGHEKLFGVPIFIFFWLDKNKKWLFVPKM